LPKFNEQNVEEYLISFEKVAELNDWPKERYASVLHAMLLGKGLKVFAEMSTDDSKDYSKLKAALLNAYSVVSEVHRTRFRNRSKQPNETYSDFAFVLEIHYKRWLEGEHAYNDIVRMREVVKLEQFYNRIHPELHSWLLDKNPQTLTAAAKLADEYNAVRKTHLHANKASSQSHTCRTPKSSASSDKQSERQPSHEPEPNTSIHEHTSSPTHKYRSLVCHYCHKKGHIRPQCYALKRAEARKSEANPSTEHNISFGADAVHDIEQTHINSVKLKGHSIVLVLLY